MTDYAIGAGMQVTLHFSLKLEDGQVIDSNFEREPAVFAVGDGKLLGGFEQALMGLKAGDKKTFLIPPEKGFGQPNPNNIHVVKRDSFKFEVELKEGLVVSFADPSGGELPGVIKSFDDIDVTVDFNHPLSGHDVTFDVAILDVKPAVTH